MAKEFALSPRPPPNQPMKRPTIRATGNIVSLDFEMGSAPCGSNSFWRPNSLFYRRCCSSFYPKLHSIPRNHCPQRLTVWEADLFSFPLLGRYRAVAGSLSRVPNMPWVARIPLVSPGFLNQALEIIARPPAQQKLRFGVVQPSRMVGSFNLHAR